MSDAEPADLPQPGSRRPQGSQPGSRRHRRRRHSARRIIALVLVALLAAIIVFVSSQVMWINRSLNHQDMLSGSANTSGTTWLILGSDQRDGTVGGTQEEVPGFRNDTILVLTKPSSGPSSLISIPRDSYVTVDGQDMKINSVAENYGYPQLVKTVEGLTGVTVDHVALIGFSGVMGIVDALGGVNLCLDYDVDDAYSGLQWTAGCHTADGCTVQFEKPRSHAGAVVCPRFQEKPVIGNDGQQLAAVSVKAVQFRTHPVQIIAARTGRRHLIHGTRQQFNQAADVLRNLFPG